jgi:predicted transcriptional regulator of viral defense system
VILSLEAEGRDVVSLDEIQHRAGVSPGFARKLAHELVRKRWLQRIRRGTYLLNPSSHGPDAVPDTDPLRIGSRLVEPYFFGFATAAELWGLLPQASRVYYIVTTTRWVPGRDGAVEFRPVRVIPERFFGAQSLTRREITFKVSDLERTVLDCLNRPEYAGGLSGVAHIFALAKPKLSWPRLGSYLDRFDSRSLALRTGFLAEHVRPSLRPPRSWVEQRRPKSLAPYVALGPPRLYGRKGERDDRWQVIQNVSDSQLFAEGEIQ